MEIQEQRKERDSLIEQANYLADKGIYTPEILQKEEKEIREQYKRIINKIIGDQNLGDC